MKKLFVLILPLILSGTLYAQDFDQRLLKSYSTEELTAMNTQNPQDLTVLNYALNNACYFSEIPKGKEVPEFKSIELTDLTVVPCFAELGLRIESQNQYLRINGTDKLLVVKSKWVLNNELQRKN